MHEEHWHESCVRVLKPLESIVFPQSSSAEVKDSLSQCLWQQFEHAVHVGGHLAIGTINQEDSYQGFARMKLCSLIQFHTY